VSSAFWLEFGGDFFRHPQGSGNEADLLSSVIDQERAAVQEQRHVVQARVGANRESR
jgi:hypothetical protein